MSRDAHWSVLERLSHSAHLKLFHLVSIYLIDPIFILQVGLVRLSVSRNASQRPISLGMSSSRKRRRRRRRRRKRWCIPNLIILALLLARMLVMVNFDRWRRMAMKTLGVRRPSAGVLLGSCLHIRVASRISLGSVVREPYDGRVSVL